jgi:GNAT superfamily N-acetyltransferase
MELGFRRDGDGRSHWITAYNKSTLVKAGVITFTVRENKCYLNDIEVCPTLRRRGVATQLVQAALEDTKLLYREIRWGIRTDDGVALKRSLDIRLGKGDR